MADQLLTDWLTRHFGQKSQQLGYILPCDKVLKSQKRLTKGIEPMLYNFKLTIKCKCTV